MEKAVGWSTVQPKTLVPSTRGAMEKPVVPRERFSGIERRCGDAGMWGCGTACVIPASAASQSHPERAQRVEGSVLTEASRTTERGSVTAMPRKRQDLLLSGSSSTHWLTRHLHPRLQKFFNGVGGEISPPTRSDPDSSGRSGSIRGLPLKRS